MLSAHAQFNDQYVRLENNDSFDWKNCTLTLDKHSTGVFSSEGFDVHRDVVSAGAPTIIYQNEFANAAGERFDSATHKLTSIDIACDTPSGRSFYTGAKID